MKDILSVISFTSSGKIMMFVTGKDSEKYEVISNKYCDSIDSMITDVIKPVIEEVHKKTKIHIKDVIIALSDLNTEVMQNRGYIVRDSQDEEIREWEVSNLLNDMCKIHIKPSEKIINIVPLYYISNDGEHIINPVGLCWKRLEGKFQIFLGKKTFIAGISNKLISQGIDIKKFIPVSLADASPFLTLEENEALSRLVLNN